MSASEAAQRSSQQVPLVSVVVHPVPLNHLSRSGGWSTGSILDVVPLIVHGVRRLFRWCFRRAAEPNRVVAFYQDRSELLTWPAGSEPPGDVHALCDRSEGRRVYIGSDLLRVAGHEWVLSLADRDEVLQALRNSGWSSQVATIV